MISVYIPFVLIYIVVFVAVLVIILEVFGINDETKQLGKEFDSNYQDITCKKKYTDFRDGHLYE